MRFALLGSGSRGNALLVEAGETRLLLDCGFNLKETERRLARLGIAPESLDGVLLTHEHSDHAHGAFRFARRHGLAVWLTHGTHAALQGCQIPARVHFVDGHTAFAIGDIHVTPYPVPHDAREPVQYVFSDGARRLGVLTDAGRATPHMAQMLRDCAALVLECNHDAEMLRSGPYPYPLKRRVAGDFGHLSNEAAAELLEKVRHARLQHVVAAHISQHNNLPALAAKALSAVLGCSVEWIGIAGQDTGLDWRQIA